MKYLASILKAFSTNLYKYFICSIKIAQLRWLIGNYHLVLTSIWSKQNLIFGKPLLCNKWLAAPSSAHPWPRRRTNRSPVTNATHLFLDIRWKSGQKFRIDFRDAERLRLLLDLLCPLLYPLETKLLHYHFLTDVVRQGGEEWRIDTFRKNDVCIN